MHWFIHPFKHTISAGFLDSFCSAPFPYLSLIFVQMLGIALKSLFLFWFEFKICFGGLKKASSPPFSYKNYDLDVSVSSQQLASPQDSKHLKLEGFRGWVSCLLSHRHKREKKGVKSVSLNMCWSLKTLVLWQPSLLISPQHFLIPVDI